MTFPNVQAAEYELQQAQAAMDEARSELAKIETFTERLPQYAVMARTPFFGQFVSYSAEGILAGVFDSQDEADRFAATVKPPPGKMFVVDVVRHFA